MALSNRLGWNICTAGKSASSNWTRSRVSSMLSKSLSLVTSTGIDDLHAHLEKPLALGGRKLVRL